MFILNIYIFNDFLRSELFLGVSKVIDLDITDPNFVKYMRPLNYLSKFAPFTIAVLIIQIVDYFARMQGRVKAEQESFLYG